MCEKKVRFSTMIIATLYYADHIDKKKAWQTIERMSIKRNILRR